MPIGLESRIVCIRLNIGRVSLKHSYCISFLLLERILSSSSLTHSKLPWIRQARLSAFNSAIGRRVQLICRKMASCDGTGQDLTFQNFAARGDSWPCLLFGLAQH
jgi:hypothetical protein